MSKEGADNIMLNSLPPGSLLKQAREKAGLSIEDIAKVTLITVPKLNALELDDYEQAGAAPAFIIGYIRAYAKYLHIPADPLIKSLEKHFEIQGDVGLKRPVHQEILIQKRKSAVVKYAAWFAALFALVFILVVGKWFFSDTQGQRTDQATPPKEVEQIPLNNPDASSTVTSVKLDKYGDVKEVVTEDTGATEDTQTSSAQITTRVNFVENVNTEDLVEQIQTDDASPAREDGFNALNASDQIIISFTDNCWLEIKDASGKKLISKLAQIGDSYTLSGEAPFYFNLGNAEAVELSVNGKLIDTEPAIGKRTKRFSVEG